MRLFLSALFYCCNVLIFVSLAYTKLLAKSPDGGSCQGLVNWTKLGPKFGYWKIPESAARIFSKIKKVVQFLGSGLMSSPSVYPAACPGGYNPALELEFPNHYKDADNATDGCSTELGFQKYSGFHSCLENWSRSASTGAMTAVPVSAKQQLLFFCWSSSVLLGFVFSRV